MDPENSYLTLQGLNAMFKAVYYLELVSIAWALITNVFRTAKCNLASQHYKYSYTGINSGSSNILYFYSAVATWFMMYETLNNDVMPNVKDVCIVVQCSLCIVLRQNLINSPFHKYKGSQWVLAGAPSTEAFSDTSVDVHEHEHDSFDQLLPATHQHQNLQEAS